MTKHLLSPDVAIRSDTFQLSILKKWALSPKKVSIHYFFRWCYVKYAGHIISLLSKSEKKLENTVKDTEQKKFTGVLELFLKVTAKQK